MKRRFKAMVIAICGLIYSVAFKAKQRVKFDFKKNDHKILFFFLNLFFDVRTTPSGKVQLNLKQRRKANYERGL